MAPHADEHIHKFDLIGAAKVYKGLLADNLHHRLHGVEVVRERGSKNARHARVSEIEIHSPAVHDPRPKSTESKRTSW